MFRVGTVGSKCQCSQHAAIVPLLSTQLHESNNKWVTRVGGPPKRGSLVELFGGKRVAGPIINQLNSYGAIVEPTNSLPSMAASRL